MKHPYFILVLVALLASCQEGKDPTVSSPKLMSQTHFFLNRQGEFRPGEKIEYFYSPNGRLTREEQSVYDEIKQQFFAFSVTKYTHEQDHLVTIEKSINGTDKKIITHFEYVGNKISRMIQDDEIDTQVDVSYLPGNRVEALYKNSNNTSFTYRFTVTENNISFEQTLTADGQVSSEITHQYDNRKSPYSLLGYTDLFFNNFSVNNKIKTDSEFYSEAFPQSVPILYEYKYNELNYPTEQITTYQSLARPDITSRSKTIFEYN